MSGGSAASAAASSVLDFVGGDILANSANAKSKRAAQTQAMYNFYMANQLMDKQNEYNKPINQMARLREAGLNPNLVYGDGGATMASASGSASVGQADVTPSSGIFNILGKMQMLQNMKQSDANIAETEARTDAIDENIKLKGRELDLREDTLRLQKTLAKQGIALDAVKMAKMQEEIDYLKEKFNWKNPNDIKKLPEILGNIYDAFKNYER